MIKWNDTLWLFTVEEYNQLPDGFVLTDVFGKPAVKGHDYIDMDIRYNHMAYGVSNPLDHPEAELFTKFKLQE